MKAATKKTAMGLAISALVAFLVMIADKAFAITDRVARMIRPNSQPASA